MKFVTNFGCFECLNGIGAVHAMCTQSRQHEVLTRSEWILASIGNADPTFNRHWVGVGLYSPQTASCTARPAALAAHQTRNSAGLMLGKRADSGPALGQHLVFAGSVD